MGGGVWTFGGGLLSRLASRRNRALGSKGAFVMYQSSSDGTGSRGSDERGVISHGGKRAEGGDRVGGGRGGEGGGGGGRDVNRGGRRSKRKKRGARGGGDEREGR